MLEIKAKKDSAEILIYDDIGDGWPGGISAKSFADEVKKLGKMQDINVRINSYGGAVFDGIAIYNTLKKNSARITVDIDGIAASIASIVAMAGDEVRIASNGFMMIHDPWVVAAGTAQELRDQADIMDKVRDVLLDTYMFHASASRETISDMMEQESWLTAEETVEAGLADSMSEEIKLAACANPQFINKFKNIPDLLQPVEKERLQNSKLLTAKMNQSLRKQNL